MLCEKCLRQKDCLPLLFAEKYPELRPMVEKLTKCEMLIVSLVPEPQKDIIQSKPVNKFFLASILMKNFMLLLSYVKRQRKALCILLLLVTGAVTYLL
ncbi:MAG: hypothetical protein KME64_02415 [Scytonematopsis contorta HA4267-MV1]|jgi:hypothetical protein|nr:hypothetical protein [Scytonematopsis contorta HA4267-MV1]